MQLAHNPTTGERLILENGEWVPLKVATNPDSGAQVGLVGGEWRPLPGIKVTPPPKSDSYTEAVKGGDRPIQETLDTIGSSVAGGLAGLARGLYGSVTGEDYETAKAAQNQLSSDLTVAPRSAGGERMIGKVGEAFDQPIFNWLDSTAESWGQNTNDYLEETPLAAGAPLAGILASLGPEVAAGVATGGMGNMGLRIAKSAGGEIADGVKATREARQASKVEKERKGRIAPTLLSSIEAEPDVDDLSAGAAQVEGARQRVATAENLPTPIPLTQGQATRNAAQMTEEYNIPKQDGETGAPLAQLQREQQRLLHQNLEQQEQPRANWMDLNTDQALGAKVKEIIEARRKANKEKTAGLYKQAEEQGAMDAPVVVEDLSLAFGKIREMMLDRPGRLPMQYEELAKLADELGISKGRPSSINNVEKFRQQINYLLNDPMDPNQKRMATPLKEAVDKALDNAPDSAAAYKRARAAYARNKREMDGNSLVTQVSGRKGKTLSEAVPDEQVYKKIINGSIDDTRKLLRIAAKVPNGVNLIHTIGQRVMMDLVESATKGSKSAGGDVEFNSAAFKKALDKLDRSGKLEALYGPKKAQELRDIAEVGETINRMPYGAAPNYSQSGNTQLKAVMDVIGRVPGFIGRGARAVGDADQGKALQLLNEQKVKKSLDIEGLLSYE